VTEPAGPCDLDWPSLLAIAARLGVRVWRLDATGQLAPGNTDTPDRSTDRTLNPEEGELTCATLSATQT